MINSLSIHNFKGLSDFTLQDVSQINLLGGKNNAGKTTVLEALFMFHDRLNPNMLLRQYNWRGVNELALTPDSAFAPIFKNFNLENKIEISTTNEKKFHETMIISYKENNNKSIKMKSNDGQIRTDENIIHSHALEIKYKSSTAKEQHVNLVLENNGLSLNAMNARSSEIPAAFLASKTHTHPNENAIRFGELDIKGQADVIIDFLKIMEPRLTGLSSIALSNGTSMLYANIGIGTKVPISYMGDGISRLLTILLTIVSTKNGIVFIDEIENGIHYSVIPKVWQVISTAALTYNCQIFATTHSYECLNGALEGIGNEMKEKFRYFRIERSKEEDKAVPKTFHYEVLKSAIDRGWEVR